MVNYWVSCNWVMVLVSVDSNNKIVNCVPIWKKFLGQNFNNLIGWINNKSYVIYEVLKDEI